MGIHWVILHSRDQHLDIILPSRTNDAGSMFALDYSSLNDIMFIGASIVEFKKLFLLSFGKIWLHHCHVVDTTTVTRGQIPGYFGI